MDAPIFASYIQLGFAGFAFLLVFVIVWLIRRMLAILDQTGKIISGNTLRTMNDKTLHTEDNPLLCAARTYFGSWPGAIAAAGIETEQAMRGGKKGG